MERVRSRTVIAPLVVCAIACGSPAASTGSTPTPIEGSGPAPVEAHVPSVTPADPTVTIRRIGPWMRERLIGRNWHRGCPVSISDLRHLHVSYVDFHGVIRSGPLIVHEDVAADIAWVFRRLLRARFPIHRIDLPPRYRPPRPADRFSTRNLTSAFNCRPATDSTGSLSHHSFGWAVDINPLQNPYVRADGSVLRRAVRPYLDRSRRRQGMIRPGDVVVRAFARIGWRWGGGWRTISDYMHFSLTGR